MAESRIVVKMTEIEPVRQALDEAARQLTAERERGAALAAQVAALTEQLAAQQRQAALLTSELTRAQAHWDVADQEVGALTAERARLREALGDILDIAERERAGYAVGIETWYTHRDAARIVLQDATTPPAGDNQETIERDLATVGYQRSENQYWTIWHGPPDADGRPVELVFPRHGSKQETRLYVQKARAALAAFGPVMPPSGAQGE